MTLNIPNLQSEKALIRGRDFDTVQERLLRLEIEDPNISLGLVSCGGGLRSELQDSHVPLAAVGWPSALEGELVRYDVAVQW